MIRSMRFSLAALALGAVATGVHAQGARDTTETIPVASQLAAEADPAKAGPTLENASVGVTLARTANARAPKLAPLPAESRQNKAMMIVGGVAFVAGAIISGSNGTVGTVVMLGGAGVGLWGLYRYLE